MTVSASQKGLGARGKATSEQALLGHDAVVDQPQRGLMLHAVSREWQRLVHVRGQQVLARIGPVEQPHVGHVEHVEATDDDELLEVGRRGRLCDLDEAVELAAHGLDHHAKRIRVCERVRGHEPLCQGHPVHVNLTGKGYQCIDKGW